MTKLSFIESEARRHLGRMPEQGLEALQMDLIKLCENHRSDIRGPDPVSGLVFAEIERNDAEGYHKRHK